MKTNGLYPYPDVELCIWPKRGGNRFLGLLFLPTPSSLIFLTWLQLSVTVTEVRISFKLVKELTSELSIVSKLFF